MAKRVETHQRRDSLLEVGFDYFQGHFLGKPNIVAGQRLPTNKAAVLKLLATVSNPESEVEELEQLISMDASLSLRVVRFVNSPLSGLLRQVDSIREAVLLLGRDILKRWVALLVVANLDDAIPELITTAFIRARLCELLGKEIDARDADSYFTVGLFSLLDAMLGQPMAVLLQSLPFTDDVQGALIDGLGIKGEALLCAQEMELGAPDGVSFENISESRIVEMHVEALQWADRVISGCRQGKE
jgi:EAL and modified HD-GYP domain-containing signal transduction protein